MNSWIGTIVVTSRLKKESKKQEEIFIKKKVQPLGTDGSLKFDDIPDYVLVWRQDNRKNIKSIECYLNNLLLHGFKVELCFHSVDENVMFAKLVLPLAECIKYAALLNIELAFQNKNYVPPPPKPFDFMRTDILPPNVNSDTFKRAFNLPFYVPHQITSAEKGFIISQLLKYIPFEYKETIEYGINKLKHKNIILAAYPIHDGRATWTIDGPLNNRQLLSKYWGNIRMIFKQQPLDLVHLYYGPEISFYFAFCGFYCKMLIPASILGVLLFIIGIADFKTNYQTRADEICNSNITLCPRCLYKHCKFEHLSNTCIGVRLMSLFDNPMTVTFAALMSIWATIFLVLWKRQVSVLKLRWNLQSINSDLALRPDFEDKTKWKRISPITNIEELYVPKRILCIRYTISISVILFLIFLMVVVIIGVMVYVRTISIVLAGYSQNKNKIHFNVDLIASGTGSMMSVVVMFYGRVAYKLTKLENPRTKYEFIDSWTYKTFTLDFVNSYATIVYIGFFKARFYTYPGDIHLFHNFYGIGSDLCEATGCMNELTLQVILVIVVKNLISISKQLFLPHAKILAKKLLIKPITEYSRQWEDDFVLNKFSTSNLMMEYKDITIQYGFITFFVAAFPLSPLIALINVLIEIRLDAYKLNTLFIRPVAVKTRNLEAWSNIFKIITYISVFTNAFIISFTSEFIPREMYRAAVNRSLFGYSTLLLSEYSISEFSVRLDLPKNLTTCYYPGQRWPPHHPKKYEIDDLAWYVMALRLIGMAVFEHVVVILTSLIAFLIPDIPFSVKQQLNFEQEDLIKFKRRAIFSKYLSENKVTEFDFQKEIDNQNFN